MASVEESPTPAVPVSSSPATVTAQAVSPSDRLDAENNIARVSAMNLDGVTDVVAAAAASPENDDDDNDDTATTGRGLGADLGGAAPPPPPPPLPPSDGTAVSASAATPTAPLGPPWTDEKKERGRVVGAEVFKQAAEKFNPVAEKMKTAAETLAVTFNETVVPKTAAGVAEVRQGWNTSVMPGLSSGGARMASFFGKVGEKMKETNTRLREKNDAFRKMGDSLSHGAATTFEAMKAGGQDLRTEIKQAAAEVQSATAEAIRSRSATAAPGVSPMANFDFPPDQATRGGGAPSRRSLAAAAAKKELKAETAAADSHLSGGASDAAAVSASAAASSSSASPGIASTAASAGTAAGTTAGNPTGVAAVPAPASAPTDPGGVLHVPLEQLAAWESHTKPVPYVVLACCHWLSAAGLQTEGIFLGDGNRSAVERLVSKFQRNPTSLVPAGCDPVDVAAALKLYLRSLPEPLLTFSLYTAVVQSGEADVSYMAELTQLLPRARRATLECVLSVLSRVAAHSPITRMDARSLAAALGPAVAWPRSGQLSQETLDKIAAASEAGAGGGAGGGGGGGGGLDPSLEKAAKEWGAVTNALQHLIENYDGIFQSDSFSLDDDDDADDS